MEIQSGVEWLISMVFCPPTNTWRFAFRYTQPTDSDAGSVRLLKNPTIFPLPFRQIVQKERCGTQYVKQKTKKYILIVKNVHLLITLARYLRCISDCYVMLCMLLRKIM